MSRTMSFRSRGISRWRHARISDQPNDPRHKAEGFPAGGTLVFSDNPTIPGSRPEGKTTLNPPASGRGSFGWSLTPRLVQNQLKPPALSRGLFGWLLQIVAKE